MLITFVIQIQHIDKYNYYMAGVPITGAITTMVLLPPSCQGAFFILLRTAYQRQKLKRYRTVSPCHWLINQAIHHSDSHRAEAAQLRHSNKRTTQLSKANVLVFSALR